MSTKLRAGFTGYYGMENFGDDLFGAICSAAARRYWNAEPLLVGPAIIGVDARCTMSSRIGATDYGAPGIRGKTQRVLSFVRGLLGSDVLVMGGGSVITARRSFRKPLMLYARKNHDLQLAAVGVSIDAFKNTEAERTVGEMLKRFSYVSVRDRRSYDLGTALGLTDTLHEGRDLAGMLSLLDLDEPLSRSQPQSPWRVGIAPCNYPESGAYRAPARAQWEAALVDAVARLAATQAVQVEVFSLNEHPHHGDGAIADNLQQRLLEQGVDATRWRYAGQGPLAAVRAIARCDAMVSARLHGAIVAYMQGVPCAIIDYHRKCLDFALDTGLPAPRLVTADSCNAEAMNEVLRSLLDDTQRPAFSHEDYASQASNIFKCAPWMSAGSST